MSWWSSLLVLVSLATSSVSVDLCRVLGLCAERASTGRSFSSLPSEFRAKQIDSEWLEREGLSTGALYHFAVNVAPMNWIEAHNYCEVKNGYLAEPLTQDEHQFLAWQASRFDKTNFWIGIRNVDDCQCQPVTRSSVDPNLFQASIDRSDLVDVNAKGSVSVSCPSGHRKNCFGSSFRYVFSNLKVGSFNAWDSNTNQPDRGDEGCVLMWIKADFRWGDWGCSVNTDQGPGHVFKPLCQKDKFLHDLGGNLDVGGLGVGQLHPAVGIPGVGADEDEMSDTDGNNDGNIDGNNDDKSEDKSEDRDPKDLPTSCLDENVVYRHNRNGRIRTLRRTGSFSACRRQCASNARCKFWVWRGDRANRTCFLIHRLVSGKRNVRTVANAFSGAMTTSCRSSNEDRKEERDKKDKAMCVEHDVFYRGGGRVGHLDQVADAEACRSACEARGRCRFFSWRGDTAQKRCIMKAQGAQRRFRRVKRVGVVSGVVSPHCLKVNLEDRDNCVCQTIEQDVQHEDQLDDDLDLVGLGLIDVRLLSQCPQSDQVERCVDDDNDDLEQSDDLGPVCGAFDIVYTASADNLLLESLTNVANGAECRSRCLRHSSKLCQSFTWSSARNTQPCLLFRADREDLSSQFETGAVSGSVRDQCRFVALNQLRTCECVDFEDHNQDLVGLGLIDVRLFDDQQSIEKCRASQGRVCVAQQAQIDLRLGVNFNNDNDNDDNDKMKSEASNDGVQASDDSAVNFG